jgi:hypothetical protein
MGNFKAVSVSKAQNNMAAGACPCHLVAGSPDHWQEPLVSLSDENDGN